MNIRYIIAAAFVLLLLGVASLFVWNTFIKLPAAPAPEPVVQEPVEVLRTYASTTVGLSVKYPPQYIINDTYAYDQFGPNKLIEGVKFTIPTEMATGTNLSPDSGVSIEWLPNARNCTGDIYLPANVKAQAITDDGIRYSVASSSEAAVGNRYEETVYAVASSTPCTAVRYFIHSTVLENYPEGAVREFDRAALLEEFDKIRRSLVVELSN